MFRGEYHGKQSHEDDVDDVIQRAKDVGCSKFMVTGSDLEESKHAVSIASRYRKCISQVSSQSTDTPSQLDSVTQPSVYTHVKQSFSMSTQVVQQRC